MSVLVTPLVHAKFAETGQTTQYTSDVGTRTIIDKITVTNVGSGGGSATIAVNIVRSGESAATSNRIVHDKTLSYGECYMLPEIVGQVLGPGDMLSTQAGQANALVIRVSGRKVST